MDIWTLKLNGMNQETESKWNFIISYYIILSAAEDKIVDKASPRNSHPPQNEDEKEYTNPV